MQAVFQAAAVYIGGVWITRNIANVMRENERLVFWDKTRHRVCSWYKTRSKLEIIGFSQLTPASKHIRSVIRMSVLLCMLLTM